ncbi:deoxyribose-phosphate aldolase [Limibacter armeniacum]|uniref:deoxyribose-phosphate aldolase n=1 Tax=Limibacter armeniacum TaxID=466084 RepID=UPI002FE677C0
MERDKKKADLNQFVEYSCLHPTVTEREVMETIELVVEHNYGGICLPPYWVKKARRELAGADTKLITVVGYPFGYSRSEPKRIEIEKAIDEGVDELDITMNFTAFKSDSTGWAKVEVAQFSKIAHVSNVFMKIIIETAYLMPTEIQKACKISVDGGADFVSLGTGLVHTVPDQSTVQYVRDLLPKTVGVKSYSFELKAIESILEAGAERVGFLSKSIVSP